MYTLQVEVPTIIGQKFSKKDKITYQDLINDYEESGWIDIKLDKQIEMSEFYDLLVNNGSSLVKDSK